MNKLKKNIIEIILQINVTSELYSELRSRDCQLIISLNRLKNTSD